jgi:hypothetical protein
VLLVNFPLPKYLPGHLLNAIFLPLIMFSRIFIHLGFDQLLRSFSEVPLAGLSGFLPRRDEFGIMPLEVGPFRGL